MGVGLGGEAHRFGDLHIKKLLDIGLVERTAVLGSHGRGRAWHLSVKHTPKTKALAKALFAGGTAGANARNGKPGK